MASSETKAPSDSRLYDRANGFLLGCFLSLIRFGFARRDFRFHRSRIEQFLDEIEVRGIRLPETQQAYAPKADALLQRVITACLGRSRELGHFALLSAAACLDAIVRLSDSAPASNDLRNRAIRFLRRYKFDGKALYDRFLIRVRQEADDPAASGRSGVRVNTVLTPAMEMLVSTIEPLPTDTPTCFVAMPFRKPYADYYPLFYRPLALELECLPFRMWGGLSGEAYVELMLAVMRRCHFIIADLSNANPNVLYEFGVARGLGKKVLPLGRRSALKKLPANIASDALLEVYSSREKDWPYGTALRCAAQVALIDFTIEDVEDQVKHARWVPGKGLPELPEEEEE